MERRRLGPVLLALACVALPPESRNSVPPAKYILHIVIDDLGWGDAWGTSHTHTPNLDELARGGVSLERLYATPMCAPSRASMFTGRHPADIGYYRNPSEDARLPPDCEHLPSHLRKLGFSSHLIGKWHLPWHSPDQLPSGPLVGFDSFFGYLHWGMDYFTHEFPPKVHTGPVVCRGSSHCPSIHPSPSSPSSSLSLPSLSSSSQDPHHHHCRHHCHR
uniref:Sulfatase N-terminal domain-containing protein n=1 Tax=Lotharella globosa TaxID=91324 RepID=A0A7S4DS42_9EUKA